MQINLTDPTDFTLENVRKLIASHDGSVNTQLRVTNEGYLFVSETVGNKDLDGIRFRLETNSANNGAMGKKLQKTIFG